MFFAIQPITELVLFAGMIISWIYFSLGIVGMQHAEVKNTHVRELQEQNDRQINTDNKVSDNYYFTQINSLSKNIEVAATHVYDIPEWIPVTSFIFHSPQNLYSYTGNNTSDGRAPPSC
jgi:hypothetical protein